MLTRSELFAVSVRKSCFELTGQGGGGGGGGICFGRVRGTLVA